MNARYVCLRCRHLLTFSGYQARQAGFVSLGRLLEKEPAEPSALQPLTGSEEKRLGTQKKHRLRPDDPLLEDLFTSSLRRREVSSKGESTLFVTPPEPVFVVPARQLVDEQIEALAHRMHVQRVPTLELWKDCQQLLRSSTWQQMESEVGGTQEVQFHPGQLELFRDILLQLVDVRPRVSHRQAIPFIVRAIKAYRNHIPMRDWWDQILCKMLSGYIQLTMGIARAYKREDTSADEHSKRILEDIVRVWQLLFDECEKLSTTLPTIRPRWHSLPAIVGSGSPLHFDISERINEVWPRYRGVSQQTTGIAIAAIMTADILSRTQKVDDLSVWNGLVAEPLFRFLTYLVQGGSITWRTAIEYMQRESIPRSVAEQIARQWQTLDIALTEGPAFQRMMPIEAQPSAKEPKITSSVPQRISNDLLRAQKNADNARIRNLWQEFQGQAHSLPLQKDFCDKLFGQFLSTFFRRRCHPDAVEVWNFMIKTGHQPTLSHWKSMLMGCTTARDITSLRGIWKNMHSAGVKPDMLIWSAWIQGLMACKAWEQGLQALDDLGNVLNSEDALTPSTAPVRAALSGLAVSYNMGLAEAVLSWAKKHSISLDTPTYNIMLRPAVQSNNRSVAKVQSILEMMNADNCVPDIATFTIMLNGLLHNATSTFHEQSPRQQQSAVFAVLDELEQYGLKANHRTYSTILDGLLEPRTANIPAAQAVMQHMARHSVRPSPHVYTILVTHYLALRPPDLPAVDSLLHRARLERTPLDIVFYDRIIEGYARLGETEKMLLTLRRMPEEGKCPGWRALLLCLRALVEAREWESVTDLVRDVEREDGLLRHGGGLWRGRDAFWELVAEVKAEGLMGDP